MTHRTKVLHLEDDPHDAELARSSLQAGGLACEFVLVGGQAGYESALAEGSFDLILCDYKLPGYDGLSALALAREKQPSTPLIMLSGSLGEETAVECLRLGATDFVLKQRLERLVPVVRRALREAEERSWREAAEAELRESKARLQEAQRIAHIGSWEHDLAADSLRYSDEMFRLLGVKPEDFAGTMEGFVAHIHPDDRATMAAFVEKVLGGDSSGEVDFRVVRPDGTVRRMLGRAQAFFDPSGKPSRVAGSFQDVTERWRAEQALRLARTALDQAADMIVWVDREGRLAYANDTARRLLDRSPEELLGMKTWDVTADVSREAWPATWEAVRQAGSRALEGTSRRKDGSVFPVDVVITHVAFGDVEMQCATIRDITERKKAEGLILNEKAFSEAMLDSLPGIFYLFDQTGRILRWNHAFETVSGYSAEEITAMRPLDLFTGEDRTLIEQRLGKVFETGAADAEAALLSKDGRRIPHYFAGVRFDVDGVPCCIGTGIDITARKHLEAQLRQSQKIEAIGRLAGGVAHDFNNILAVITGYGELAQRQLAPDHPVRARVDQMVKAAARAAGLTRQLLAFSRKQTMQPKPLDLNVIVADTQKMLGRLIGEDIDVVVHAASDLGTVNADPGQIEQVILNLAVNARDAMPKGGSLTLDTTNLDLDEDYAAAHPPVTPGRYVMLMVSDTGVGMDQETQHRIFEPFFTTKPEGEGTGLGLATVYGIVKQSGGHIWAYSEPGRGTTFKVYLPRVDEPPEAAQPDGAPTEAPGGHETILLVEDTETLQEVIRETLEERGYTLLLASNGEEALALAGEREGEIHLLLTDVVMPKLGGGDLAKMLLALRPRLRVLYMSGYTDGAISQHGVLGTGVMLLEKPFTATALAQAVRKALDSG